MPRKLTRRGGMAPGADALPTPDRACSFEEMLLPPRVLQGLARAGLHRPSPVQQRAIPLGRFGADVVAQAKAGTGKSAAFAAVLVERAYESEREAAPNAPEALLLAPTRETALQADRVVRTVGDGEVGESSEGRRISHAFVGGTNEASDRHVLQRGVWLACATPGRARALITRGWMKTQNVRMVVLDEADALMGEALREDVQWILDELPDRKQTLAFSATYPTEVLTQLEKRMRLPQRVMLCEESIQLQRVKQFVKVFDRFEEKEDALVDVLNSVPFHQTIVFCSSRRYASELAERLQQRGIAAVGMSADLAQSKRVQVMDQFACFHMRVLVATDLLARGVDLHHVNLVVNMDLPKDGETYLHRIGRAGRFAAPGIAISLVTSNALERLKKMVDQAHGESCTLEDLPKHLPDEDHMYEILDTE